MNDSTDLLKVKERISKLLAMAEDSCNEHESAAAAARARKLMDKYQIDLMDIGEFEEEFGELDATRPFAAVPSYLSTLAVAVAKFNDCIAAYDWAIVTFKKKATDKKQLGKKIMFQGYVNDVKLAVDMFNYLQDAVATMCKEYMSVAGLTGYNVRIGKAFKLGAIAKITERLEAITKERAAIVSESTGTGLVLFKSAKVAERFGQAKYEEKASTLPNSDEVAEALYHGRKAGEIVEIQKSVEEENAA